MIRANKKQGFYFRFKGRIKEPEGYLYPHKKSLKEKGVLLWP